MPEAPLIVPVATSRAERARRGRRGWERRRPPGRAGRPGTLRAGSPATGTRRAAGAPGIDRAVAGASRPAAASGPAPGIRP